MSELWDAYVTYWKKYVDVHSLSTRMEYWTPTIANTILINNVRQTRYFSSEKDRTK